MPKTSTVLAFLSVMLVLGISYLFVSCSYSDVERKADAECAAFGASARFLSPDNYRCVTPDGR